MTFRATSSDALQPLVKQLATGEYQSRRLALHLLAFWAVAALTSVHFAVNYFPNLATSMLVAVGMAKWWNEYMARPFGRLS